MDRQRPEELARVYYPHSAGRPQRRAQWFLCKPQGSGSVIDQLARGNVDLALFGHVHTYVKYSLGGVECHPVGGGGGWPCVGDGVGGIFDCRCKSRHP